MANSMHYIAPFNLNEEQEQFVVYATSSFGISRSFSYTTGSFFTFLTPDTSIEDIQYLNLLDTLKQDLFINGFGNWNYSYNFSTAKITLSSSTPLGVKFTFNSFAERVLGIVNDSTNYTTNSLVYTGSYSPKFQWNTTLSEWQNQSLEYEWQTIVTEEECDDGRVYAMSNEDGIPWLSNVEGNYTYRDWTHTLEEKENVFSDHTSSLYQNTFEGFIKHVRSVRPFVVFQPPTGQSSGSYSNRQGTYKLRAEGTKFAAKPSMANFDQYWDVDFKTRQLSLGDNFISSSATEFSPSDLGAMTLWLRSDRGVTLSGSDVTLWQDQSGNNRTFYMNTTTKRPKFLANEPVYNNLPTIYFDGISTKLVTGTATSEIFAAAATGSTATIIVNMIPLSGSVFCGIIQQGLGGPTNASVGLFQTSNTKTLQSFYANPFGSYTIAITPMVNSNNTIVISEFDASKISSSQIPIATVNGIPSNSFSLQAASSSSFFGIGPWGIGGTYVETSAVQQSKLLITDIMIYPRLLTLAERTRITTYLQAKNSNDVQDPIPIKEEMSLWIDLTSPHTVLQQSGSNLYVAAAGDNSGHRRIFSQVSGSKMPLYIPSDPDFGGYPSMQFDGIDDFLNSSVFSEGALIDGATIYFVKKGGNTASGGRVYAGGNSTIIASIGLTTFEVEYTTVASTIKRVTEDKNIPYIYTAVFNPKVAGSGSIPHLYQNGISTGSYISTGSTSGRIQERARAISSTNNGTALFSNVKLCSIIAYGKQHTPSEVALMTNWLKRRYKIT